MTKVGGGAREESTDRKTNAAASREEKRRLRTAAFSAGLTSVEIKAALVSEAPIGRFKRRVSGSKSTARWGRPASTLGSGRYGFRSLVLIRSRCDNVAERVRRRSADYGVSAKVGSDLSIGSEA